MVVSGNEILIDSSHTSDQITGAVGGTALFYLDDVSQPTGTGVFDPFLTLNSNGNNSTGIKDTEQAYNTSGNVQGNKPPLDGFSGSGSRNTDLQLSQLQSVMVNGASYFAFSLDANEPANYPENRLSIDNIRIYVSPTGGQTTLNPDSLGNLVFALNDPLSLVAPNGTTDGNANWVNLDAAYRGSGAADLFVYIPTAAFLGVDPSSFVYFYNLDGIHESAQGGTGADATFEEWSALKTAQSVPDGGITVLLLGTALASMGLLYGRRIQA